MRVREGVKESVTRLNDIGRKGVGSTTLAVRGKPLAAIIKYAAFHVCNDANHPSTFECKDRRKRRRGIRYEPFLQII